ncbi:MAG TPA: cyclase [Lachnospiraceae bacterium]|nr:cyclase [Lachnospiraceae bacterium]
MTHAIEEGIPYWPTQPKYEAITMNHQKNGDESYWRKIIFCEHTGTHIDAGSHFILGARNVDEIPITQIMGRGVKIDVTDIRPKRTVSISDIQRFESQHGSIKKDDIVFFRFGWDEKWGVGNKGAGFLCDWPGTSAKAARYLLDKGVKAVGTDTLALDAAGSDNPSHKILLGNGVNIIENVNKLGELPVFFGVIGFPCKFKGGSGATMRLVAVID